MSKAVARFEVHRTARNAPETTLETKLEPREESLRDCRLCKREDAIRKCPKFRKMSVGERWKAIMKYHYCFNCLAHSHMRDKCTSRERCRECVADHHTLLHRFKAHKPKLRSEVHSTNRTGDKRQKNHKKGNNRTRPNKNKNNNTQKLEQLVKELKQQLQRQQQQTQQIQSYTPQLQPRGFQHDAATIVINVKNGRIY